MFKYSIFKEIFKYFNSDISQKKKIALAHKYTSNGKEKKSFLKLVKENQRCLCFQIQSCTITPPLPHHWITKLGKYLISINVIEKTMHTTWKYIYKASLLIVVTISVRS